MIILGIETSCDETACAVTEGVSPTEPVKLLSSVVASSEEMHVKTGGVVPEVASREQVKSIIPVVDEAIKSAKLKVKNLDTIAVTMGPGLIGSLLVGIETAKSLAWVWKKPLVQVNHLVAHLYANYVCINSKLKIKNANLLNNCDEIPSFPAIGLIVSGGHTELILIEGHGKLKWLGGTRDDAAGECFDKCSRLLRLGYPGGPAIAEAASRVQGSGFKVKSYKLPRPLLNSNDYDFSFSGLKTAVLREVSKMKNLAKMRKVLSYEIQEAIVGVLVTKLTRAIEEFKPKSVLMGGGVTANSRLRDLLNDKLQMTNAKLYIPPLNLCGDNAAMVATAAYYNFHPIEISRLKADSGMEIANSTWHMAHSK